MGAMEDGIRRIDASTAKYSDFVDVMKQNQPAILHRFADLLPSFLPWQKDGRADVSFLRREFGDMEVPVVECSPSEGYGEERRVSMTLRKYLDAVHDGRPSSASPDGSGHDSACGNSSGSVNGTVLYLKDWHFQRLRIKGSGGGGAGGGNGGDGVSSATVETPFFFEDDWLNWWCDRQGQDDYRFVYIGPSGSFTGLHHDVLNSFSWSFNVCGSKHWTLFPTEATPDLYDRHGRDLAKDVRTGSANSDKFPNLDTAPRLEVWQGPGEAIFVPSGWHHQVVNTGDGSPDGGGLTVSVNTNWFNGFNLERVFDFLRSEVSAVRAALDHLRESMSAAGEGPEKGVLGGESREWERQCELVMRANSALNLTEFARIVAARARQLLNGDVRPAAHYAADSPACADAAPGGEESRSHLSASAMPALGGVVVGRVEATPASLPLISVPPPAVEESLSQNSGGGGGGGSRSSGAWQEERWTAAALEQVRAVLRELLVAPCADHIFLADDDYEHDRDCDGNSTNSSNFGSAAANNSRAEGGAAASGGSSLLRETVKSVEAYLLDRCRRQQSKEPSHLLQKALV